MFFEFICVCFRLGPVPQIFIKLLKIWISLMRRVQIRLVIHLDNLIIMETMEEVLLGRDTVMFILQNLGFVKIKKNLA